MSARGRKPFARNILKCSRVAPFSALVCLAGGVVRVLVTQGIFQASANGVDPCREYSRPRPMMWTHVGNIPGLSQWCGPM
eukprot:132717-Pyramimonas_sp.AAC.1